MLSVILSVFSCTLIVPPSLLFASSSFVAETSSTPPVVAVAYVSLETKSFALISAPVEEDVSWYSVFPEILILAPVAAVVFNVFKSTIKFCLEPV